MSSESKSLNDQGRPRTMRDGRITIIGAGNERVRIDPATGDVYKNGVLVAKGPRRSR
jgi:hypothetical protein